MDASLSLACVCPKEVAQILGISERSALRLMATGEIESFRAGRKLWRTTLAKLERYQQSGFERQRFPPSAAA